MRSIVKARKSVKVSAGEVGYHCNRYERRMRRQVRHALRFGDPDNSAIIKARPSTCAWEIW